MNTSAYFNFYIIFINNIPMIFSPTTNKGYITGRARVLTH